MSSLKLTVGDIWEIEGQRYLLDPMMGNGFLHMRNERTGAPLQISLDGTSLQTPTHDWLAEQFAAGCAHRIDLSGPSRQALSSPLVASGDYETILEKDPKAAFRQSVLTALDRLNPFSLSDKGIRKALATIWEKKPQTFAGQKPPSPGSVRTWLNERGETGSRQLKLMVSRSGKTPRKKRLPLSVHRRMHKEALAYWADRQKTIGDAYDDLCFYLKSLNSWISTRSSSWRAVPIPSMERFRIHIRSLECYETILTKYGKKEADKRLKANGPGLHAHRPLALGALDHTLADYHVVVDFNGWKYLGRPWLTIIIDVYTRCVVGWVLTFEPPSLYSATECIKRSNRPKLRMLDRFPDCPELQDIYGKFNEIIVDNGWEFTGSSFESAMIDMGTSIRWAPIRSPTYKAIVERFFGTLNTRLHRKLPGGTLPIEQMRAWGIDPQQDAVLTLEQAEDLMISAIGVYHQEIHSSLAEAPIKRWSRAVREQGGIQVIGDDRQLDRMLGASKEATLTTSGVKLFNLQFHDPAITGPILEDLARSEPLRRRAKGSATVPVKIKYNPADLGQISFWHAKIGQFVELPCTEPEYAKGLSKWQHDCMQTWIREEQVADADQRLARRIELRREIEKLTPDKVLSRSKRAHARLLSSPKIEALASSTLRVEYAQPRHDGMAPVIPTASLATERTDDHAKPVRPARGSRKRKAASRGTSEPKAPVNVDWSQIPDTDPRWEGFK
ncbi:integrase catalytic domain-containing protein [Brevundimonas sp.]|uniref:integrase catalytic domain-containing protein n=1 Tax=Brevundimonas sp. TaxID=1871086 RepID=UPI002FC76B39